jgi:hypothetical protein
MHLIDHLPDLTRRSTAGSSDDTAQPAAREAAPPSRAAVGQSQRPGLIGYRAPVEQVEEV